MRSIIGKMHLLGLIAAVSANMTLASPASAQTGFYNIGFAGGFCRIEKFVDRIQIDRCRNRTGLTVDDIHLTFSHRLFEEDSVFEDQFPPIQDDEWWEGVGGSMLEEDNPVLWTPANLIDGKNWNSVLLLGVDVTGYWTRNGNGVPEPASWAMMLLGFFGVGAAMRAKPVLRHSVSCG